MIRRVAYLSMHTSPLLLPGFGDAGGMNVYIDELSRTMCERGVEVDVFTRCQSPAGQGTIEVQDGYRVHHIVAGPKSPIPVRRMARYVRDFANGVEDILRSGPELPDIIHSHYWLSGWAGLVVKRELGIPLANSFHTLGRIKDLTRRSDEPPEPLLRIAAEHEVIEGSDCVVASTPLEAADLMEHYGADPARLCTSPPGVDHTIFCPGDQREAREELGLGQEPLMLFVGRIQPLKGVDVAIESLAMVRAAIPDARMVVIGGPSGPSGDQEMVSLRNLIERRGLTGAVAMLDPVPHRRLAAYYRAADVLTLPSRSETFGLVAAEAQACGLPVVAAQVGGLRHVVSDGESGRLVEGWNPADHARVITEILEDEAVRQALSKGAVAWSERFSWEATAHRFLELYSGAVQRARAG
jgi:D-inositol-3-phosphate glycosyltransferase